MDKTVHKNKEAEVDPRVDLAALRTELGWERTLLAWMRTALSLTGAGIAFDKGTRLLHQERVLAGTAIVRNGHLVGLTLTAVSTLLLAAITGQFLLSLRALSQIRGAKPPRFRPAILGSGLVILLGIAVFVVLALDNS